MWISRKDWTDLNERVKRLEASHSPYDDPHSITVYKPSLEYNSIVPYPMPSERIMLKDLVMHIVKHLGMGLKYRECHPGGVDMVPLNSSPAAQGEDRK